MASRKRNPNPALALVLAWLIPGAGHVYARRPLHGIILFIVITATFWTGMGFGGALTVDPRADRWWFMAESITGVHGIVGYVRQKRIYADIAQKHPELADPRDRDRIKIDNARELNQLDTILAEKGIALVYPTDVVARAYAGVAGLLNLLCIFDATMLALMGSPRPRKDDADSTPIVEGVA
jgi:hypothetical protein